MNTRLPRFLLLVLALAAPPLALANDVDGPNDCTRPSQDFGDAPDGIDAYPGIMGLFPTCLAPGTPAGIRTFVCPPISTAPGAANGYVRHVNPAGAPAYWLGCFGAAAPSGIDSEADGKINLVGAGPSTCNPAIAVDNMEGSWLPFGQDEAYGDTDAGLGAPVTFSTCKPNTVTFRAYSCAAAARTVMLNILVDWNRDGDWNDNFECPAFPALTCAYEWAVKNQPIVLGPGCTTITSPSFLGGPNPGEGWMRITITDLAVPDDYPWNGSAGLATTTFQFGETEDYPVTIAAGPGSCTFGGYRDFGDAPEGIPAYPGGVIGRFPTCLSIGPVATLDILCGAPIGPVGPAGAVIHDVAATDLVKFWLGCPVAGFSGVDGESDGKVNIDPPMGVNSACDPAVIVDTFQPAWLNFGQDEAYGDADAGLLSPLSFLACDADSIVFRVFNCSDTPRDVFVNVLVDWNQDGDWTDNIACSKITKCAHEWAIRNIALPTNPGCNTLTTPKFRVGSKIGPGWMRLSITDVPVPDDFPWNGSMSTLTHTFLRGETEDYPIRIDPSLIGVNEELEPGTLGFAAPLPNPARNQTQFRWSQPDRGRVSLAIYDVVGRKVAGLVDREMEPGLHEVDWNFRNSDGNSVAPGVYMAKLRIGEKIFTTRVIRTH